MKPHNNSCNFGSYLTELTTDILFLYLNCIYLILCHHKVRKKYAKTLGKDLQYNDTAWFDRQRHQLLP